MNRGLLRDTEEELTRNVKNLDVPRGQAKAFLWALCGIGWGRGAVGYSRDGFLEEGTGFNRK